MPSNLSISQDNQLPLVVDLDGTLIRSDLLIVSLCELLKSSRVSVFKVPFWLLQGKSVLKERLASCVSIDISGLPYNDDVIAWLKDEKKKKRTLILSTASNEKYAHQVADYLGFFDAVQASTKEINLSSYVKRNHNVQLFGEGGFDYVGNSMDDIPIWQSAACAILVHPSSKVLRMAKARATVVKIFF